MLALVNGGVVTRTGSIASLRKEFRSRLLGMHPRDTTAYELCGQVIQGIHSLCASVSLAEDEDNRKALWSCGFELFTLEQWLTCVNFIIIGPHRAHPYSPLLPQIPQGLLTYLLSSLPSSA